MLVKEIMTPGADSVGPGQTLQEAARKMRDINIGSLPVWEDGQLLGMITDRDICCRAIAEGRDPTRTTVRDIMSRNVACCFSDDDIADAAQLMERKRLRRLAVLNRDRTMAGFLTVDDLAHHSHQLAGYVLDSARATHRDTRTETYISA
ncbi:MAG TPA: CBS domain-containing protein [Burkholderiales bacterium]|nr:CBS domain-containing protein [Burkholderiales bacterium]